MTNLPHSHSLRAVAARLGVKATTRSVRCGQVAAAADNCRAGPECRVCVEAKWAMSQYANDQKWEGSKSIPHQRSLAGQVKVGHVAVSYPPID